MALRSTLLLSAVIVAGVLAPPANAQASGRLTTVAGNGTAGSAGDGSAATQANIDVAYGVAVDAQGNLFIADSWNHRIRKVTPVGAITTLAGTGAEGSSGDLTPATSARLFYPRAVAVDGSGNVYVADSGNSRVRVVGSDGIIRPFAGSGTAGFQGDGGAAQNARLNLLRAIAVDSAGSVFIADTRNYRIRRVARDGIITTIAGNGQYGYDGDGGRATDAKVGMIGALATDKNGSIFMSDVYNHVIRKIAPDGTITTFAGNGTPGYSGDGGPAKYASLRYPRGIGVDDAGNLYIADSGNHVVRKVTPDGAIWTNIGTGDAGFSGDGPAGSATMNTPYALAVTSPANIFIGDSRNYRIRLARLDPLYNEPSVKVYSGGVVNGASFASSAPVSAGAIVSLFGKGLAATTAAAGSLPLPTVLAETSVNVNGIAAPLFFVSPDQINFQIPWKLAGQTQAAVTVTSRGMTSTAQTVRLATAAPGVFAVNAAGQGVVLIASTGELVAPSGSIPGRASRPAKPGEFITIFCTGLGPVENTPASGAASSASSLSVTTQRTAVTIGGLAVPVSFAGLAPGFVGLYQVNVQVPESVGMGDAMPVVVSAGGVAAATVTIAVDPSLFNYSDFRSTTGMVLNGNATQAGSALRLTQDGSLSQVASAWHNSPVPVAPGFDSNFTFRISTSTSWHADGLAFVIQNAGTGAVGTGGGSEIGLAGIGPGVAIVFRTHTYDLLQLTACGPNAGLAISCSIASASAKVADGQVHRVLVHYEPNLLQVSLDGNRLLNANGFNIADKMTLANGTGFVGFTGSTGGSSETADVLSWNFAPRR